MFRESFHRIFLPINRIENVRVSSPLSAIILYCIAAILSISALTIGYKTFFQYNAMVGLDPLSNKELSILTRDIAKNGNEADIIKYDSRNDQILNDYFANQRKITRSVPIVCALFIISALIAKLGTLILRTLPLPKEEKLKVSFDRFLPATMICLFASVILGLIWFFYLPLIKLFVS